MKIGDEVRVITHKPSCGWGSVNRGDIGIIKQMEDEPTGRCFVKVDFPQQQWWNGYADEFELIHYENNASALTLLLTENPFDKDHVSDAVDSILHDDVDLPF